MNIIVNFFKKHKLGAGVAGMIILVLAGGLAGALAARNYLFDPTYNLAEGKYAEQGFVISNAKNVIVQQDAKINETLDSAAASLVGIYKKQKPKAGAAFAEENFYKLNEPAGQGFIITSDGWIVTAMALDKTFSDYVVITKDKKIYPISKAIHDNLTGFYFIQSPVRDFPVRKFADGREIKRGMTALSLNRQGLSWISSVEGMSRPSSSVKSSDNFSERLVLNEKVPQEFKGSVIFNLAGDAMGMVDSSGEVQPIASLKSAAKSLFKNKTAIRPAMGVNYLDLSELAATNDPNNDWQKGALIYKDAKGVAVIKNSAADKAGLREGDLILSVDNADLNQDNDLAAIIGDHIAGDKLIITYRRAGEEKEAEVTLGELK